MSDIRFYNRDKNVLCGFTLIELIISLFLIITIGSVVVSIFFSALRGSGRSSAITIVRQNGNSAMLEISRLIRSAKSFNGVSIDGVSEFSQSCVSSSVSALTPTPTPAQYAGIQVTAFDNGIVTIKCPTGSETAITSNSADLVDTGVVSVSSYPSCSFTCYQASDTDLPTIGISFILQSNTIAGSIDAPVTLPFQTTIVPRNFVR